MRDKDFAGHINNVPFPGSLSCRNNKHHEVMIFRMNPPNFAEGVYGSPASGAERDAADFQNKRIAQRSGLNARD